MNINVILPDGKEILVKCTRHNNIAFIKKRIKEIENTESCELIDFEKGKLSDVLMIKYLSNLTLFLSDTSQHLFY